jgi:hypothetical protein
LAGAAPTHIWSEVTSAKRGERRAGSSGSSNESYRLDSGSTTPICRRNVFATSPSANAVGKPTATRKAVLGVQRNVDAATRLDGKNPSPNLLYLVKIGARVDGSGLAANPFAPRAVLGS